MDRKIPKFDCIRILPMNNKIEYIPITQITEKTFKSIRYGMSFLSHGTVHTLNALEDMGYNTYKEIFGNYIDDDYKTTNDNIVEIIKKIDPHTIGIG